jgi:hypothetical protein
MFQMAQLIVVVQEDDTTRFEETLEVGVDVDMTLQGINTTKLQTKPFAGGNGERYLVQLNQNTMQHNPCLLQNFLCCSNNKALTLDTR